MILATICARVGSVGFPNKNLLELGGKSLVEIAVQKARECKLIDHVVLSTDIPQFLVYQDQDFASIGRPAVLAGGAVSKWTVLQWILKSLPWGDMDKTECVIDIDVTRPLTTTSDILHTGTKWLNNPEDDHVFAVCRADRTPYQDIMESDHEGHLTLSKGPEVTNRHDAPPCWYHGGIWVYDADAIAVDNSMFDGVVGYHEIESGHCLDIDDRADWDVVKREFEKAVPV